MVFPWLIGLLVPLIWLFWGEAFLNLPQGNNTYLFFSFFTQFSSFAFGVSAYSYFKSGRLIAPPLKLLGISVLAIVTVSLFYSNWVLAFAYIPMFASAFFALLLLSLIEVIDSPEVSSEYGWKPHAVKISGVSYEMYLLHTVFSYYLVWYIRRIVRHLWEIDLFNSSVALVIAYLMVVVLSYYSATLLHPVLQKISRLYGA